MFSSILIANRGESAVRIIRACKEMGLRTIAVYSQVDRTSPHVKLADESVCIGADAAKNSYLNALNILSAAKIKGAEAIHPGIGFFAEDECFARLCLDAGLVFIGPSPQVIKTMGDKLSAKLLARKLHVPVLPGTQTRLFSVGEAKSIAAQIGYSIVIKAVGGGGGKGIRVVNNAEELDHLYYKCGLEAENAFGNKELLIEKYIPEARHVEVQILADRHGHVVHLGERECSVQSGKQKFVEETPCLFIPTQTKLSLYDHAIAMTKAVGYVGVGTVEFLVEPDGNYFFLEMNTRLQVEHSITEMISGVDIVAEQIRIHMGEPLSISQEDVMLLGHSIECRIGLTAANTGKQIRFDMLPSGFDVRTESGIMNDSPVTWFYDPLLLKVIVKAQNRNKAIQKMKVALDEVLIHGVKTNLDMHKETLCNARFVNGNYGINDFEGKYI